MTTSQCVRAAEDRNRWKEIVSQAMVANEQTWSAENKKKQIPNKIPQMCSRIALENPAKKSLEFSGSIHRFLYEP